MASKRASSTSISYLSRISSTPAALTSRPASRCCAALLKPHNALLLRPRQQPQPPFTRLAHSIPRPRETFSLPSSSSSSSPSSSAQSSPETNPEPDQQQQSQIPQYELTFTCVPCGTRSRHRVSKQGYHHGSVLIACPGCKNRHVISDNIKIFGDKKITVEDLLRERGLVVKKGTLGEEGDIEFWEDGTTTVRDIAAIEEEDRIREAKAQRGPDNAPPGASFKTVRPREKKEGEDSQP